MPYKRKPKVVRYKPKRKFIRKKKKFANRLVPFIPNYRTTKHIYADEYEFSLAAGSSATRLYSGNGLYDPDISGTGHQPYGFDQLTALYKYYNVYACALTAWIVPTAAGTNLISAVAADATASTTPTISNVGDMWEKFGSGNVRISSNTDGSQSMVIHKRFCSAKKINLSGWKDDTNKGTAAANPANQWYWNCALLNNGSTTCSGKIYVRLTFYTKWSEPLEFVQS